MLKGNAVIKIIITWTINFDHCQYDFVFFKLMSLNCIQKIKNFTCIIRFNSFFFIISCFIASELYLLLFLISTPDVDLCDSSPCKNNGTCIELINRFQCQCPVEFNGTTCSTGIKWISSKIWWPFILCNKNLMINGGIRNSSF